jgi:8-oxo-dGTP diphosphatase
MMAGQADVLHVAAAIIRRGDHILALRGNEGATDGRWEFPKTKVKEGEACEEALRRGVLEELGCPLATMWPLDVVEHDLPGFHVRMDCFVCSIAKAEAPVACEHRELRWLTADELLDVEWASDDRMVVTELGTGWSEIFSEGRF